MKFKVGQVWEDGNGEAIWIESVTGEGLFRDVLQPVVGRDISGYIWCYTENGYHGHTEENLRVDNLVRLISEPAEEAEPEVSEETDTPPVTLELMQEFTAADEPASEPTIEPGEEFGPEKFELAKTYPPGEFEYWDKTFEAWRIPFAGCPSWLSSDRYRRKPESQEQTTESVAAVPTKRRLKVMIVGHGRHGKDTVAQILADELGLTFCSSSYFCAKAFIYDALKNVFGYRSIAECYEDRNTSQRMRDLWHTLICAYNRDDPARLSREILSEHDIYVGIRSDEEFAEAELEGLFDLSIWVDASERLQLEDESSFEIERSDCDIVIDNNYSEEDLIRRVTRLAAAMDVSQ
jgi:hypothetical protein